MSADPLIGSLADTQSVNPYAYVGNRPLSSVDPTGLDPILDEVVISAGGPTNPAGIAATIADFAVDLLGFSGLFGGAVLPPPATAIAVNESAQAGLGQNVCNTASLACGGLEEVVVMADTPAGAGALGSLVPAVCQWGEICLQFGHDPTQTEYCSCLPRPSHPPAQVQAGAGPSAPGKGASFIAGLVNQTLRDLSVGVPAAVLDLFYPIPDTPEGQFGADLAPAVQIAATGAAGGIAAVEGAAAKGVTDMAAVRALGQAGEDAVRAVYNIGPKTAINVAGRTRVPDGLLPHVLSEVKNVRFLNFTQQLRDFAEFVRVNPGMRFDLYVRPTTEFSGPLQDAIESGAINPRFIPSP